MASTVWRGYVAFGLISIPVRLFRAARAERVSLRRVYREEPPSPEQNKARLSQQRPKVQPIVHPPQAAGLAPLGYAPARKDTGEVVPAVSVVKGFEYEKNRFVPLEPEELKSIAASTAAQMEIQECVRLSDIDPVYFETSYYAVPEEAGEKAYALFYSALRETGLVALARFAMHQREHVVVLRPGKTGIVAHTMFYASEVRADDEYRAESTLVAAKELELAEALMQSLAAPFEPQKYRDTYRERLESIISRKLAGQTITVERSRSATEVVDIAEALRKSFANIKKPAQPAPERTPAPVSQAARRTRRSERK